MCPVINAASSGGSRFIVTSGLVETGNWCLLIGVAARELAHDTLGHVQSARAAGGDPRPAGLQSQPGGRRRQGGDRHSRARRTTAMDAALRARLPDAVAG